MLSFLSVSRRSHHILKPCRHSSSLSLPSDPDVSSSSSNPGLVAAARDLLRERRFADLTDSLSRPGNPSRVWSYYTRLLNYLGFEKLPLEIHQQVLRQCTPSSARLRISAARRLIVGNKPTNPHIHEGRFRTIIRTMRAFDLTPALDDYNFILEQFAAVGHHVGAMHVYKELVNIGLTPRTRTFGLCLQAIAHRLTLPVAKADRPDLVQQSTKMLADLTSDMQKYGILLTSVNLDLSIRILKETTDMQGFERLMKWAYGIDLANPDCPPLEYMGLSTTRLGDAAQPLPVLPAPLPFSTAALNTTIDTLGQLGNISKLVQAFEVLTQPLPNANQHQFSSFDDDDDVGAADGFVAPKFTPPHASPNTTTYNLLLRHICRAGHATLARHYLIQAIRLDRQVDSALRFAAVQKPVDQIPAPHFALNRGTLLSPFGESNRDKNVGLMRWLHLKIPSIIRRKKSNLAYFTRLREELLFKGKPIGPSERTPRSRRSHLDGSVFDLNIDAPPDFTLPPVRYLDLNLHIELLQRDLDEITHLERRVVDVLGRTTQRVKERLGRRVWAGKDIYLRTTNTRKKVDRKHWEAIVQFRPRRPNTVLRRHYPHRTSSRRTYSTRATREWRISRAISWAPGVPF